MCKVVYSLKQTIVLWTDFQRSVKKKKMKNSTFHVRNIWGKCAGDEIVDSLVLIQPKRFTSMIHEISLTSKIP